MSFLQPNQYRTHTCGGLRESDAGITARLAGWVHTSRDMGGVIFIDLRDKYGLTQVVFDPKRSGALHAEAEKIRAERRPRVGGDLNRFRLCLSRQHCGAGKKRKNQFFHEILVNN